MSSQHSELLLDALRRMPTHARMEIQRLANGRPIASPLSYSELSALLECLGETWYAGLETYYMVLDELVSLGAGASRQEIEDKLQGIETPKSKAGDDEH
jgi:hypothetical protein